MVSGCCFMNARERWQTNSSIFLVIFPNGPVFAFPLPTIPGDWAMQQDLAGFFVVVNCKHRRCLTVVSLRSHWPILRFHLRFAAQAEEAHLVAGQAGDGVLGRWGSCCSPTHHIGRPAHRADCSPSYLGNRRDADWRARDDPFVHTRSTVSPE
jgi:hypothetical protein